MMVGAAGVVVRVVFRGFRMEIGGFGVRLGGCWRGP